MNQVKICTAYTSKHNTVTVHGLELKTDRGEVLSVGNQSGTCSTINVGRLIGITGGEGAELDRLGIIYTEAVSDIGVEHF